MNTNPLQKHLNQDASCSLVRSIHEDIQFESEDEVAALKQSLKAKSSKSSKSEKFASSLSSAPTKPAFEPIASSDVAAAEIASIYEERLATYKKWPHASPTPEDLTAAEFCYESGTKDLTACSECGLKISN